MAYVIGKIVDMYIYLNDEISGKYLIKKNPKGCDSNNFN